MLQIWILKIWLRIKFKLQYSMHENLEVWHNLYEFYWMLSHAWKEVWICSFIGFLYTHEVEFHLYEAYLSHRQGNFLSIFDLLISTTLFTIWIYIYIYIANIIDFLFFYNHFNYDKNIISNSQVVQYNISKKNDTYTPSHTWS